MFPFGPSRWPRLQSHLLALRLSVRDDWRWRGHSLDGWTEWIRPSRISQHCLGRGRAIWTPSGSARATLDTYSASVRGRDAFLGTEGVPQGIVGTEVTLRDEDDSSLAGARTYRRRYTPSHLVRPDRGPEYRLRSASPGG